MRSPPELAFFKLAHQAASTFSANNTYFWNYFFKLLMFFLHPHSLQIRYSVHFQLFENLCFFISHFILSLNLHPNSQQSGHYCWNFLRCLWLYPTNGLSTYFYFSLSASFFFWSSNFHRILLFSIPIPIISYHMFFSTAPLSCLTR